MKNAVQLITYVDRLGGGGLRELRALLTEGGPLAGLFGGVHLLPFYDPIDGADAGFDPIDHTRVDPRLGDWSDLAALASRLDVMSDVIVNHVSIRSPQFLDFSRHGAASRFAGLFLDPASVFPGGPSAADLAAIYRPRPGSPLTPVVLDCGEPRTLWTTFTPEQVDIDVQHPEGVAYLESVVGTLAAHGVKTIRLDAVGYAVKKAGTRSFMIPETFAFIDRFGALARAAGLEVLVEVHGHHRLQIEIARRVDRVYDFALPPLVLHAIFTGRAGPLRDWIGMRPTNALVVLDTHDGIGIVDIGGETAPDGTRRPGLVDDAELDSLVETIHAKSRGQSREATGEAASNVDLYQVNCTFHDALGRDDEAYLLARALQFFLPGVPQVYYVGLLAGANDMDLLRATGVGRDINRHRYDRAEIDAALDRPVVRRLLALIRRRNDSTAFDGTFSVDPSEDDHRLVLRWSTPGATATLSIDFATLAWRVAFDDGGIAAPD